MDIEMLEKRKAISIQRTILLSVMPIQVLILPLFVYQSGWYFLGDDGFFDAVFSFSNLGASAHFIMVFTLSALVIIYGTLSWKSIRTDFAHSRSMPREPGFEISCTLLGGIIFGVTLNSVDSRFEVQNFGSFVPYALFHFLYLIICIVFFSKKPDTKDDTIIELGG